MNKTLTACIDDARQPLPPFASRHALWVSLGFVMAWAFFAARLNSAQFGDNVEQYNWAQSLELGYHKHPPLPSWALGTLIQCFGPSLYWAYFLAAASLLGTATFTWAIGRRIFGEQVAGAGVVLWGLSLSFSQRAQLYNHNTVLVFFVAATVWLAMRAGESARRSSHWWWLAGAAAAGAVLSKYQALIPLAGLVVALKLSGQLRSSTQRNGLVSAVGVMLVLSAPHVFWVVRHDFSTLRYASEAVAASTLAQRLGFVASFLANQVRLEFPALLATALCIGWARVSKTEHSPRPAEPGTSPDVWSFGLVGLGLVALLAMAICAGVSLRNHWGVQALQFLALWIAYRWNRWRQIDLRALAVMATLIHAVGLGIYAVEHRDPAGVLNTRRIDTLYPARRLAQAAVAHWTETTSCPLRYVAGAVFDSGLVSLYSGGRLTVFDSASATPWVNPEDVRRAGSLYVLESNDPVPLGVTSVVPFELVPGHRSERPDRTIRIGVSLPQTDCSSDAADH